MGSILNFFIGLKAKAIAAAVFLVALASALIWQRHAGKVEGAQIAAGKSAQAVETAARVSQVEQARAQRLPPGKAAQELAEKYGT